MDAPSTSTPAVYKEEAAWRACSCLRTSVSRLCAAEYTGRWHIYEVSARQEMSALEEHETVQFPRASHRYYCQPWEVPYDFRHPLNLRAAKWAASEERLRQRAGTDAAPWAASRDRQRSGHAADSRDKSAFGESALSVCLEHSMSSEQIYLDIRRLRAYVPGALKTEDDFIAQQAAIRELERELGNAGLRRRMCASVSRDIRRTLLPCAPKSTAFGPQQPNMVKVYRCQVAIVTHLQRLMYAIVKYGCGDGTIDVERNTRLYHEMKNRERNFGGNDSQIVFPQKTCHEWRSYWATDNPLQRALDIITSLWQGLRIYRGGLTYDGDSRYPKVRYSVRDLLSIVNVVPHLASSADHRQQLKLQCDVIAESTRDYYDTVLLNPVLDLYGKMYNPFSFIDDFMHPRNGIVIDQAIFAMA